MPTNETLYKQIKRAMATKEVSKKLTSWLEQANKTQSFIDAHHNKFNEWKPLKFYVTLGTKKAFSIRYKGQEVATLSCSSKDIDGPTVKISKKQITSNLKFFKYSSKSQEFKWRSPEGTRLRKHFRGNNFKVHSPEHSIESGLISALINPKPVNTDLRNLTAVLLEGFPLQFPVPFSASKGTIGKRSGHLDILGRKNPNILSIWELKSPSVYKGAARQAYIYALQVYSMINDPNIGKDWLELFKIGRKNTAIRIEILVGVAEKFKKQVEQEIYVLKDEMKVDGIEKLFSWNVACYSADLDPHKISIQSIR